MEMRKTTVWVSRSLGLLFVFSSFSHLAEANSSKSQIVQKKVNNSQVSGSTGRMATIGRFCKKHWYLAIPAIGVGALYTRWLKNNSVAQKNKSNSVEKKPEQQGAAQEKQQQSVDNSMVEPIDNNEKEKSQTPELAGEQPSVNENPVNGNNDFEKSNVEANSEKPWWWKDREFLAEVCGGVLLVAVGGYAAGNISCVLFPR